jgi:hypothetical protein
MKNPLKLGTDFPVNRQGGWFIRFRASPTVLVPYYIGVGRIFFVPVWWYSLFVYNIRTYCNIEKHNIVED